MTQAKKPAKSRAAKGHQTIGGGQLEDERHGARIG